MKSRAAFWAAGIAGVFLTAGPAWAHVFIREPGPDVTGSWHIADTPIGTFFHLLGDIVSFPFYLLGNLF